MATHEQVTKFDLSWAHTEGRKILLEAEHGFAADGQGSGFSVLSKDRLEETLGFPPRHLVDRNRVNRWTRGGLEFARQIEEDVRSLDPDRPTIDPNQPIVTIATLNDGKAMFVVRGKDGDFGPAGGTQFVIASCSPAALLAACLAHMTAIEVRQSSGWVALDRGAVSLRELSEEQRSEGKVVNGSQFLYSGTGEEARQLLAQGPPARDAELDRVVNFARHAIAHVKSEARIGILGDSTVFSEKDADPAMALRAVSLLLCAYPDRPGIFSSQMLSDQEFRDPRNSDLRPLSPGRVPLIAGPPGPHISPHLPDRPTAELWRTIGQINAARPTGATRAFDNGPAPVTGGPGWEFVVPGSSEPPHGGKRPRGFGKWLGRNEPTSSENPGRTYRQFPKPETDRTPKSGSEGRSL